MVVVDTTDHLVITLSGVAIRTGPDRSSADKGRSAIIIGIDPIGIVTDHLCETVVVKGILAIFDPVPDRLLAHRLVVGIPTNQLDHLQVVIRRPTTVAVWTIVRNACRKLTRCPAHRPLEKGQSPLLLVCLPPTTPPPPLLVSAIHPSRPARGNPGSPSIFFFFFFATLLRQCCYLGDRFVAADGFIFNYCHYYYHLCLVDLLAGPDPGRIRGHPLAVAEVVPDPILRLLRPLFHRVRVRDQHRAPDFDRGPYLQVDRVRVPVVRSRLPAGRTRHPVPPNRRVLREVEVHDPHKVRRDRPAGCPHRLVHGIRARPVTDCRPVVVRRPSTHHPPLASYAIHPDQQALVMVIAGHWPFVSAICR